MTLSIALTKAKLSRLGLILEEDEPYSPPDSAMRERYNHIREDIHSSNRRDRDRQRSSKRNQEDSPDEEHSSFPPCEGEFREEDSGIFELREEEMEENHQSIDEFLTSLDLGFPEFSPRKDVSGEKASGLRRSPSSCKSLCSLDEDCTRAEVDIKGVRTGRAREKYKKFACLGDTKGKYQHPLSIN